MTLLNQSGHDRRVLPPKKLTLLNHSEFFAYSSGIHSCHLNQNAPSLLRIFGRRGPQLFSLLFNEFFIVSKIGTLNSMRIVGGGSDGAKPPAVLQKACCANDSLAGLFLVFLPVN